MRFIAGIVLLCCAASTVDAQRVCKKGIPCGNTCIAANRTCRLGPAKLDSGVTKDTSSAIRPLKSDTAATARRADIAAATGVDSAPAADGLAKNGQTKVWANTKSRVYHCPGSRYYGNSSAGEWMTEAAAIKAGYRGAYNKRCGK